MRRQLGVDHRTRLVTGPLLMHLEQSIAHLRQAGAPDGAQVTVETADDGDKTIVCEWTEHVRLERLPAAAEPADLPAEHVP